jgi:predicted nucleotidyltransferase component of viral defense system
VNQAYLDTARLMIQVVPLVFAENVLALKGGTAINLFVRDMPRLSVDLDLVFVDHRPSRDEALRWKLENPERLAKVDARKFREQARVLERLLGRS